MLYSAYNADTLRVAGRGYNASSMAAAACTNCSDGATPPQGSPGCPFQRGTPAGLRHLFVQMMAVARSPDGPWEQREVRPLTMPWDWNTALTINPDNSAVALIRGGMVWHATNYSDNATWHPVGVPRGQSPQWPVGVEDPDFTDNVTAMNWTVGGSAYGNRVQFID
eukprot:gene1225-1204_t